MKTINVVEVSVVEEKVEKKHFTGGVQQSLQTHAVQQRMQTHVCKQYSSENIVCNPYSDSKYSN